MLVDAQGNSSTLFLEAAEDPGLLFVGGRHRFSYSTVVLYIGIMKVRGFWIRISLHNQLKFYILTVRQYLLGIAESKNVFDQS